MKNQLIFLCFIICVSSLSAQTVIGAAGSVTQNSNGSVSYTIGESVVQTVSSNGKILTQGFQQPKLKITTFANEVEESDDLVVYPNPTSNHLYFISPEEIEAVTVFNLFGKFIFSEKNLSEGIDFQSLPNEVYSLKIKMNNGKFLTEKVVKIN